MKDWTAKMLRQGRYWNTAPVRELRRQDARQELAELLGVAVTQPGDKTIELRQLLDLGDGPQAVRG